MSNVNCQMSIVNCRQRGFTIIEIMVVLALMTSFLLVLISNFPQIRLNLSLSRTVHGFLQNTRKIQNTSMKYKDANGVERPISGYGVYVDMSDNKKYIIYADKYPGNFQYDLGDYLVSVIDLSVIEPGIIIKEVQNVVGNNVSINFTPPGPTTTITQLQPNQSNVNIIFAIEDDLAQERTVSVNTSGLVEIK